MTPYPDSILALELTDHCNCRCVMCSQSAGTVIHGQRKGRMDPRLVEAILEQLARSGARIGKLLPFGLGESTVHPDFPAIMETVLRASAAERLFGQVDLHTNGIAFDRAAAGPFLDHADQVGSVTFSLDACREETFAAVRGSAEFRRARENAMEFLRLRRARGLARPTVILQFIVMEENAEDLVPFVAFWRRYLNDLGVEPQVNYDWDPPMSRDTIFVKRMNPFRAADLARAEELHRAAVDRLGISPAAPPGGSGRILATDEFLGRPREVRRPCSGPFKFMNVAWDGALTVCCIDTARELSLGTVGRDGTLPELWEGARNEALRMAHIRGDLSAHPACARCRNLDGPRIGDAEIVRHLERRFLDDEAAAFLRRMAGN